MAIEKQPIPIISTPDEEIELEITAETPEETEVFLQPDGSVILGSDMPEQSENKFGQKLADLK